jgi:diaminopimelate decarboxylase
MTQLTQPRFLSAETAERIRQSHGTPVYVYDLPTLQRNAATALAFPNAFGLTVRYAIKACPNAAILGVFRDAGLHIDASSGHEVRRALRAGFVPEEISLSSQELPADFAELFDKGVWINACSLHQIERIGREFPGREIGVRFNPGAGSGGTNRTNVGGPSSSFGIWHERIDEVRKLLDRSRLQPVRIHTHIGSGSDPLVWQKVSLMSLAMVKAFPTVTTLNLGGGYKVARMPEEKATDLQEIGAPVAENFRQFAAETGRQIRLEIEPGTFLVANACAVLATIQDTASTGTDGYDFLKLDTGMTEILRPSLYGARHPIATLPRSPTGRALPYIVVGHCCESGDILTPAPAEPEKLEARLLAEASIGDLCVIDGAGAYCSAMATKHYNSFPEAAEVLLDGRGTPHLIRRRQPLEQIWQNEVPLIKSRFMNIIDDLKWRGLIADCTDLDALTEAPRRRAGHALLRLRSDRRLAPRRPPDGPAHPAALPARRPPPDRARRRRHRHDRRPFRQIRRTQPPHPRAARPQRRLHQGQLERLLDFEAPIQPRAARRQRRLDRPDQLPRFPARCRKAFFVNVMLAKESVKSRMEGDSGISYTEFSYQLLQAYDFYHLRKELDCELQIGGTDQWGNITAGTDFIRKKLGQPPGAWTFPLITKSDGTKFGKTEAAPSGSIRRRPAPTASTSSS